MTKGNESEARMRWSPNLAITLAALVIAAFVTFSRDLFNDGDTSWHLATGRWILDHGRVPDTDPFSFTCRGCPWTAHEWLADVAMAGIYGVSGWTGLALLFGFAAGLTFWLIGRALMRALPVRWTLAAMFGIVAVAAPSFLARPHLLAWPVLLIWLTALLAARDRRQAPPLVLVPLMTVWANLHASYVVGIGLAGLFALEALIEEEDRRRVLFRWGLFGVAAVLATAITPHGLQGFLYPFETSSMQVLPLIREWRPLKLPDDLLFVILATLMVLTAARSWRRVGFVRLLLLAGLLVMAVQHWRHQPLSLLILAPALVPRIAGHRFGISRAVAVSRSALAVLILGGLAIAAIRFALPIDRRDDKHFPVTALTRVPPALRGAPVLNDYSFGGPMILMGYAPFIDGRADMYGDDLTLRHARMMQGDERLFAREADRWGLRWTIVQPRSGLAKDLARNPQWREIYRDPYAVVHARIGGTNKKGDPRGSRPL